MLMQKKRFRDMAGRFFGNKWVRWLLGIAVVVAAIVLLVRLGGDESQAERIAELEKKLAEFLNTRQGQGMDLPERLPNGRYIGTGLGGGLGFHPSYDPNALQ